MRSWLLHPLLWLALFACLNATVWSFTIPLNDAPDEPTHLAVSQFIVEHERLPEFGVDEGMGVTVVDPEGARLGNFSYARSPLLPYATYAGAMALPPDSPRADHLQARAPAALMTAATAVFAYLLAAWALASRRAATTVGVMVACWPQLTFVGAYVNVDAYSVAAGAGLMWTWWRGAGNGWRARDAALTGLMAGLVLQGKMTSYPLLPLAAVAMLVTTAAPARSLLTRFGAAAAATVAASAWWLVTAWQMYGWDLFASRRAERIAEGLDLGSGSAIARGMSPIGMLVHNGWIDSTARSFVGVFGWLSMPISGWSFLVVGSIVVMGLVGAVIGVLDRGMRALAASRARMVLWGCTLAPIAIMPALSIRHSYVVDFQAQGRYLFAALVPLLLLVVHGLRMLAPSRRGETVLLGYAAWSLACVNLLALVDTLHRAYDLSLMEWLGDERAVLVVAWLVSMVGGIAAWVATFTATDPDGTNGAVGAAPASRSAPAENAAPEPMLT